MALHGNRFQLYFDELNPFDTPGIGLAGLRQGKAHRAIRRVTKSVRPLRGPTVASIDTIKASIANLCNFRPSDEGVACEDVSPSPPDRFVLFIPRAASPRTCETTLSERGL